jgi:hypothetical protein
MKLTKKEKEGLIGKRIVVGEVFKKENEWPVDNSQYFTKSLRKIEKKVLEKPVKAVIIGFTHLCNGIFDYDNDGMSFTCTKRIPCIKIATGITGKIQYAPIGEIVKDVVIPEIISYKGNLYGWSIAGKKYKFNSEKSDWERVK